MSDERSPREDAGTVAGTVAILGRPNVGKSTLLNRIVGEKLAIVSPKPQTTRNRIRGVWNGDAGQIVFVDTPGVHVARSALNRFMVDEAMASIDDVDAALLVAEAPQGAGRSSKLPGDATPVPEPERSLIERLREANKPIVLALNKVDLVKDKKTLLPWLAWWSSRAPFAAVVPISATKASGVERVVKELLALVPAGPPLYGPDELTDRTERFLVGELIREQLFLQLRQELPYSTAVDVEHWEERTDTGDVVVDASILVERDSQKAIVLGKGGAMIRELGTAARGEATKLLGRPVHLRLHVKVTPDWTTSPAALADLGYRSEAPAGSSRAKRKGAPR
jgi:GTP-binding protein Era